MIGSAQIRAARGLLGLSQAKLAQKAGLSAASVKRLEAATGIRGAAETVWKIESTLEQLGIEFIPAEGGKGPGVRLRHEEADAPDRRRR